MTEEEFRGRDFDAKKEAPEPLMQFFEWWHTPRDRLHDAAVTQTGNAFHTAAKNVVAILPRNAERTVALRKLLEARDCAMRAAVMK